MILMQAPAPGITFSGMPSGATYVADPYGLIRISNNSTLDQAALEAAGCYTLSPFGSWGSFIFDTLADLYAADAASNLVLTGTVGFPMHCAATVQADPDNNGVWYKTGIGSGDGNWSKSLADLALNANAEIVARAANQVLAAIGIQNNLGVHPTALPFEVTGISGGIGTGVGGTPGEYALIVTGGPSGHQAFGTIDSSGKVTLYRNANPGISTSNTAPTYAWPSDAGFTIAPTAPTATIGTIPVNRMFSAPSSDGTMLQAWGNNAGDLATAPFGGTQLSMALPGFFSGVSGASLVGFSTGLTYDADTVGSALKTLFATVRMKVFTPVTVYVDQANGTDQIGNGTAFGTSAFKTIQYAYLRLCCDYDHQGLVPTIQCAGPSTSGGSLAAQIYTSGLLVTDIDMPLLQTSPTLVGVDQLNLDVGGSTIQPPPGGNRCITIRGPKLYVLLSNAILDQTQSAADCIYVYGGGCEVGLNGGITFKGTQAGWAMMQASRPGGRIHTRPNTLNYSIAGSAGYFAQSIVNGGSIELEGVQFAISPGLTFDQAFFGVDSNSTISVANVAFTGANITGKQYKCTKGGLLNTNAQTGGMTCTINGASVVTNNYATTTLLQNGFIPGSIPGEQRFLGGIFSDPGNPTVTAGGGTGPFCQNTEPSFQAICGTGNPTSMTITMPDRAQWTAVIPICRNPAAISGFSYGWISPTDTAPGKLVMNWTVVSSSNGLVFDILCA